MTDWSTMWKQATVLFLVLAGGLAMVLFSVKYEVQDLEDELTALNREIAHEHRAVHVLHAEFSHLVEASRLSRLASRHLHMEPIQPDQLTTFVSLREEAQADEATDDSAGDSAPGSTTGSATGSGGDSATGSGVQSVAASRGGGSSPVTAREGRP